MSRLVAFLMAMVLIVNLGVTQVFAAGEAQLPPNEIQESTSNFGTDFKITFSDDAKTWLSAVTAVTVGGIAYTKADSSYGVWRNTSFYVDASSNYLLIGEAFEEETTECVVQADGYADLALELNKSNHTAVIKDIQGGGTTEHTHTGGIATCQHRAVCSECAQEYGELGDHTYENGKCTECGLEKIEAPSVAVDNSDSTYFILKVDNSEYMQGISSILCNDTALEETGYKIALNGTKYYLDKENNAIYFDKMSGIPFQSGDIITIQNPEYSDLRLKISIGAGEVSVNPVDDNEEQGDAYKLHVRLVGYFEAALVNQKGYDAMSSASTNITQNKNSDVSVEVALLEDGVEPTDSDWKLLNESGIKIDPQNTKINMEDGMGMTAVYSIYDSSITLAGIPTKAGEYKIGVTVTDDQGRTATSNDLIFKVYSGQEYLEDQLVLENCTQTADQKYMYDMEPWAIRSFNRTNNIVTVPKDIKAWYGSHTSGTYGEIGYAISQGLDTTQTLIIPEGCNLTFVNMDILSSVRIIVENGATLSLRDSTAQGVIDVKSGGRFSMNYNEYEGKGEFLTGASINGQVILRDGAILENSKIYSNTNFVANGTEVRKNTNPVIVTEGNVTINGQVFLRGDEAPTGTDSSTDKSFSGQQGLLVKDGTLNITEGSVLAVYGGGYTATTSVGGAAITLDNASISGEGKLIAVGGKGTFDNGGNAVQGKGVISVANAYLEGGNSYQPKAGSEAGKAVTEDISLSDNTNRNLIDGKKVNSAAEDDNKGTYWSSISNIPDLSLYVVEDNAPGEHEHIWKTEWSSDEKNHWHECEDCDEKKDLEAHTPGPEATETTPQTCTVCGYIINPVKELKDVNNLSYAKVKGYTYTGNAIEPAIEVSDGDYKLKLGTDYTVTYENNTEVGTANIKVKGIGNYKSEKTLTFQILQKNINAPNMSISDIGTVVYTGKEIKPSITLKHDDKVLELGKDYTITYKNNKSMGRASATIEGIGNYKSKKTKTFAIIPKQVINPKAVTSSYNSITLTWSKLSNVTGYRIYRSTNGKSFSCIATLKGSDIETYTDKSLTTGKNYYYKVRAYFDDTNIDKRYYGAMSDIVKEKPLPGKVTIKSVVNSSSRKATLSWNKVTGASGYEIYQSDSKNGTYTRVKTVTSGSTLNFTKAKLEVGKTYYYKMRAYTTVDGSKKYGTYSNIKSIKVKQ